MRELKPLQPGGVEAVEPAHAQIAVIPMTCVPMAGQRAQVAGGVNEWGVFDFTGLDRNAA